MHTIALWFAPLDIISMISTGLAGVLGIIFLLIISLDRICHTVSMMLLANTSLSTVFFYDLAC